MVECAIQTDKGVKVADVAWRSDEFVSRHGEATPYLSAPDICVEVLSPSNSKAELDEKRALYFARGAQEVWLYHEDGRIEFFSPHGSIAASRLVPDFESHF
jgi:Uma2 family endonuclease